MAVEERRPFLNAEGIMDSLRQPLLVLSADLRVQEANESFYRTFEVTPQETIGRLLYDLGDRQWNIPALRKLLEEVFSSNTEFEDFEVYRDFPGIGQRALLLRSGRILRDNAPTDFILLAIEDVTERGWIRYFNLSFDLLAVASLQGFFVAVNQSFERVLGYTREEILSRPFYDFVHPDDKEKTLEATSRIESGENLIDFRNRYRRKDGKYLWFDWTCPALLPGDHFLYAAARDVTNVVALEEQRKKLNAELTRSNAELQQFAYVASHDLQEPLRAVAGCSQILQRRYQGRLDDGADELIGHVVEGVNRMQSLINDLLEFSRIPRGGGELVSTDLNLALGQALRNLEASRRETGALLTQDPLPTVFADPGQITRVFQNLISNALKFRGAARPTVHVGAQRTDGAWRLFVRDNGIGIQTEYFERIFVLFQRLHTRAEYRGTGIGLAICKKIVERHGGCISVESEIGTGSTFSFTIPDKETEA
jgi:PAS domain S-box-containing protein